MLKAIAICALVAAAQGAARGRRDGALFSCYFTDDTCTTKAPSAGVPAISCDLGAKAAKSTCKDMCFATVIPLPAAMGVDDYCKALGTTLDKCTSAGQGIFLKQSCGAATADADAPPDDDEKLKCIQEAGGDTTKIVACANGQPMFKLTEKCEHNEQGGGTDYPRPYELAQLHSNQESPSVAACTETCMQSAECQGFNIYADPGEAPRCWFFSQPCGRVLETLEKEYAAADGLDCEAGSAGDGYTNCNYDKGDRPAPVQATPRDHDAELADNLGKHSGFEVAMDGCDAFVQKFGCSSSDTAIGLTSEENEQYTVQQVVAHAAALCALSCPGAGAVHVTDTCSVEEDLKRMTIAPDMSGLKKFCGVLSKAKGAAACKTWLEAIPEKTQKVCDCKLTGKIAELGAGLATRTAETMGIFCDVVEDATCMPLFHDVMENPQSGLAVSNIEGYCKCPDLTAFYKYVDNGAFDDLEQESLGLFCGLQKKTGCQSLFSDMMAANTDPQAAAIITNLCSCEKQENFFQMKNNPFTPGSAPEYLKNLCELKDAPGCSGLYSEITKDPDAAPLLTTCNLDYKEFGNCETEAATQCVAQCTACVACADNADGVECTARDSKGNQCEEFCQGNCIPFINCVAPALFSKLEAQDQATKVAAAKVENDKLKEELIALKASLVAAEKELEAAEAKGESNAIAVAQTKIATEKKELATAERKQTAAAQTAGDTSSSSSSSTIATSALVMAAGIAFALA